MRGAPRLASIARVTLPRLWAFLAIALPALGAVIANLPSVDLTYHLRAGRRDPRRRRHPDHRHLDVHGVRRAVDRPAVGRAGHPRRGRTGSAGWTGLVVLRAALIGLIFGCLLPHRPAARAGRPATRRCCRWRRSSSSAVALALRPQLIGMALFAVVLRARHRPARAPGPAVGGPVPRPRLGQHPRQLLPRAGRARARLARGRPRPRPEPAPGRWSWPSSRSRPRASRRSGRRSGPTRSGCPPTGRSRTGSPSGSRPRCDDLPGHRCSSGRRWPSSRSSRGAGRRRPGRRLPGSAVFFVDRRLRDPRRRLVAARGGRRDRRRPRHRAGSVDPARPETVGPAADAPAQRRRRRARSCWSAIALLPVWRPIDPASARPQGVVGIAPPGITAALRDIAKPGDRLFNPQPWGSWFEFALPDLPVAIDSRIELFPPSRLGRLRRRQSPASTAGRRSSTTWDVTYVVVAAHETRLRDTARGGRLAIGLHATRTARSSLGAAPVALAASAPVPAPAPGPSGLGAAAHRAARVRPMTEQTPDLDVVVLGGGGHVGLPLSLAFARAGLRVGIYDTNQATLDRIAAGEMPFMETGADELLREVLPTGRLAFGADGSMIERTMQLVVVIGTPVDEFLGPSMTIFEKAVDQIAPHLREGALVALRSTVYPGTTGYVAQHLAERGCTRRRRLLPGTDRRGPRARGAPHAAPDHRRRRRPSRPSGRPRCSGRWPARRSGRRPRKPSWRSSSPTPGGT